MTRMGGIMRLLWLLIPVVAIVLLLLLLLLPRRGRGEPSGQA